MTAITNKSRVNITASQNRLKLRFTVAGERYTLNDRLKDTPEGWKAAEMAASQIELDILSGNFDPTLAKYKSNSKVESVIDSTPRVPTIQELWKDYVKYRSKVVKKSTLRKQFQPITNYLGKLPYKHLEDHIKIQDRIWNDKTPQGAKRLFTQLSAMCKWAVSRRLISENPFEGKASEIKLSKSTDSDEMDVNPFTVEERGKIIAAFSSSCYYSHYAPFIEFLFFTGCRPSEAAALTWEKVGTETLRFDCAAVSGMPSTDIQEGTKTQRYREFPINDQLKAVLGKVKASTQDPDALVFSSPKGKGIDIHNFSCRAWTKILAALDLPHRKFYQTRHTFITLCLDAGIDAKDVAKWVGNSPEMIYRHYAGRNPNLDVPEL